MDKRVKLEAIKSLRKETRAGIMDCGQAFTEAQGDHDKAIQILYLKALKKVEKLQKNETSQNFVYGDVNTDKNRGVLIQLSCQTDFVGNDRDFTKLARDIVETALKHKPSTIDALLKLKVGSKTIKEQIDFWIAAFGENIVLSDYQQLEGEYITCFVQPNKKSGSLVESNRTASSTTQSKDNPISHVAMQITTNKPMAITAQQVADKLQAGGRKIPNIEKIAQGKALLTQPFFKKESQTIEEYLKEIDPSITIKAFVRAPKGKK